MWDVESSAKCRFIFSFSSLRNLQRCVRLWREEVWNGAAEVPLTKGRTHRLGHSLLHLASTWSVRLTSNYRTFALMFCSQAHPVGDPKRISLFLNVICHLYLSFLNICILALLGLCCCTRVFSSGGVMGSHCGGFSGCGARALEHKAAVAAPQHVGSPQTRDGTRICCTARWVLRQGTTREV